VDALDGRPGIYSARYAGAINNDAEGARRSAAFSDLCGSAGAPIKAPVCQIKREGFSPSGGRINSAQKLESAERNALLLEEVGSAANRKARFVCAMVLMYHPARFFVAQETMEGEIVKNMEQARGAGGFGYDPILFIPELGRTVAELSEEEKNTISHRGKAGKTIAKIMSN